MNERRPRMTQEALAERVGVSQRAVAGWLNGTMPYPKTMNKICLALGIRRDWLMYGEGEKSFPKGASIVREMPPGYSRREKITFIEEQAPELLPLVDAFLESVQKQLGVSRDRKPARKTRRSSK